MTWLMGIPIYTELANYDPDAYAQHAGEFSHLFLRFWNCDPERAQAEWERVVEEFVLDGLELYEAVARTYDSLLVLLKEAEEHLPDCR